MKLLVVSTTYVVAFNQRKWVEMKRQCKELELRILTRKEFHYSLGRYSREIAPELTPREIVDIRDFGGQSNISYIFNPIHFLKILKEFQPDRIHIEEDPFSLVGVETVFLAQLFCPKAKISFFICDNLARDPRFPLNKIKWSLNHYSLARAELVICINQEAEDLLRGKKRYTGKTAVLPHLGLDENDYSGLKNQELRGTLHIPENIPLIGYIGRLAPEKGITLFLESLLRLLKFPWRAIIVGSGTLEEEISSKWKPLFGERLIFHKAVPHTEVPAYMRALDIFVLPSISTPRWKEQFGLVLAQAMLAGVPCIGSSSGAIPDVIGPGGLVFRENNAEELTSALERLITNEDSRETLGEAARQFALQYYTHTIVVREHLNQFGWLSPE